MKNIAAVAVAAIGLSAGAIGWAAAGTGDSPASPGAPTSTTAFAGKGRGGGQGPELLRRTVHGDLKVQRGDGFETVTLDRGTVAAVDSTSLTLHRADGVDVTVALDDQTRYRGVDGAASVQKDRPAIVVSKDGTARLVAQRDPNRQGPRQGRRPGRPAATPTTVS
ncbi:MAG: hypothetical protein QOJ09_1388 [Actinomycetota bacterium]|jgi:hypothetical protein|nr:hypothetical protein [Actinomycetota bacterium]